MGKKPSKPLRGRWFGCGRGKHPGDYIIKLGDKWYKCTLCNEVWPIDKKKK